MSVNSVNSANAYAPQQKSKFTAGQKAGVIGASALGAGAGLGAGYFGAMGLADKFYSQINFGVDLSEKRINQYIDDLGDLVIKFAKGETKGLRGVEAHAFFEKELRPPETRAMEEFIKKNGIDEFTDPKKIRELWTKFAKQDEQIREYIKKNIRTADFSAAAKAKCGLFESSFKKVGKIAKTTNSYCMKKQANKVLKKCKGTIIGATIAGAVAVGGITLAVLKNKQKKENNIN